MINPMVVAIAMELALPHIVLTKLIRTTRLVTQGININPIELDESIGSDVSLESLGLSNTACHPFFISPPLVGTPTAANPNMDFSNCTSSFKFKASSCCLQ